MPRDSYPETIKGYKRLIETWLWLYDQAVAQGIEEPETYQGSFVIENVPERRFIEGLSSLGVIMRNYTSTGVEVKLIPPDSPTISVSPEPDATPTLIQNMIDQSYWFGTGSKIDWTIKDGFTMLFSGIVRAVRTEFALIKLTTGIEIAPEDHWEPIGGNSTYKVRVNQFSWLHFVEEKNNLLVQFRFEIFIKKPDQDEIVKRFLCLTFPDSYPVGNLVFTVDPAEYTIEVGDMDEHHIKDNIIQLPLDDERLKYISIPEQIRMCMRLMVWHLEKFGF